MADHFCFRAAAAAMHPLQQQRTGIFVMGRAKLTEAYF